nr:1-(5-phosphoribosyl)-5-((5-phosphoribosylamino)methylideneamino)imidazole-4-carboxamide isomerase [Clostridia bacterium]
CDIKDGFVSVKGWTESSGLTVDAFLERISGLGVRTVIVTDVSKDGTLKGPNFELYSRLSKNYGLDLIASGGVSSAEDIVRLKNAGIYGAIIGKAYYEGKVDLKDCLEKAK